MYKKLPKNTPQLLRKHGLKVVEVDGWYDRGRPASTGDLHPGGVLCHHTATSKSSSVSNVLNLLKNGRSDLPGPLCHFALGRDGTVYIVAAGRANHAGKAKASGTMAGGDGNALYWGIEAMNAGTGEKWSKPQYDAYVRLCAAISVEITKNSHATVRAHKETSVTGKIDPAGPTPYEGSFDMGKFRTRVKNRMTAMKKGETPAKPKVELQQRWATRETGVYDKIGGKLERKIPKGYSFDVIKGSGSGKGGWVETSSHNWVDGNDTSTKPVSADPEPKVTSHTRWATKATGVFEKPGSKKVRDLKAGEHFEVIDGSGHGHDGWVETTHHHWVNGHDTTTVDPAAPKQASVALHNIKVGRKPADVEKHLAPILKTKKPDVMFLVEAKDMYGKLAFVGPLGYQARQQAPKSRYPGYASESANIAVLIRKEHELVENKLLVHEQAWRGPKAGVMHDPRIDRYVVLKIDGVLWPFLGVHGPFGEGPKNEAERLIVDWVKSMTAKYGRAVVVGDFNQDNPTVVREIGKPASASVDGAGIDLAVYRGVTKVKGENLDKQGSDHDLKIWTFKK